MTLYQLEVFLAVVKTGSFTRAAELLHTSQSGVSHSMADLEKELGVVLFSRSRNGVKLTDAGEQIYEHVEEIANHTAQINQIVAALKRPEKRTIRIGAFQSFSAIVIPSIFQAFRTRYPGVELLLFEGSYAEIEAWVKTGTIDLGFLSHPGEGMEIIHLISDPYVAILPASHPLVKHDVIFIDQLISEPFLSLKSGCERPVMSAFEEKGLCINKKLEVAENSTIITMVEAGIGVSIIPAMILSALSANIIVKPLDSPIIRKIGLAVPSQHTISPIVATFIKETQRLLQESV